LKHTRHIEISVERREISVVRPNRQTMVLPCDRCGAEVEMVPVETAVAMTGMTPRMLYRGMEEKKLHFIESVEGKVLLCTASLKAQN
jgi:hypothetical protein